MGLELRLLSEIEAKDAKIAAFEAALEEMNVHVRLQAEVISSLADTHVHGVL